MVSVRSPVGFFRGGLSAGTAVEPGWAISPSVPPLAPVFEYVPLSGVCLSFPSSVCRSRLKRQSSPACPVLQVVLGHSQASTVWTLFWM